MSLDDALSLAARVLIKTMDTATPSSERLEFAVITRDETATVKTIQRMLTNQEIDNLLKAAIEEQKQQQKESGSSSQDH